MAEERLQKILARAGVSSRRAAEQLITSGQVRVNGKVVTELGTRADPDNDRIEVDGRAIGREEHVYFIVHKPRGMVTTLNDPEGRPSLVELLRDVRERIYPIGRLDFHTSGALLLTNDGDLAQALLHPSREVPKTYVAKISHKIDDKGIYLLRSGVKLDDGYQTRPASVVELRDEDGKSWLELTITEGKNRQIHRMIEAIGARVMRLSRLSFAGISSEGLRPGQLRALERSEIAALYRTYLGRTPLEKPVPAAPQAIKFGARVPRQGAVSAAPRAARTESQAPRAKLGAAATRGAASSRNGAKAPARKGAKTPVRQATKAPTRKMADTFDRGSSARHKKGPS